MDAHIKELFDLTGKVAFVTGGAGWLGTSICEALAQAGATVAIVDCDAERVDKTVAQLNKSGLKTTGIVTDVMDEQSLRDSIDKVVADHGRIDVLVSGVHAGPQPAIDDASYSDFDRGLHNGPSAYGIAAQHAVRHMRKTGGGSIINIGSMYGVVTGYPEVYENLLPPNSIVYQASKAAIIHMTRYMAVYWAKDNIRVNCLSPGPFSNATVQRQEREFISRLEKKIPLGRIGQPWEMKGAIVFLASNASTYVTGQNLLVDGGWTAW